VKVEIACGGTGGHIFPGVATAMVLEAMGHEVRLWIVGKNVESDALKGWKGEVVTVPAEGLPHGFSLRTVRNGLKLLGAAQTCRKIMKKERPNAVLAMGSYASVGPVLAGFSLRVPVVLHEANVIPGRAIALFSRWATAVAASFEETRYYLRRKNIVVTGMPLRPDLEKVARQAAGEMRPHDAFTILAMGGSQGAHKVNDVVSSTLARLYRHGHRFQVIHLTGPQDENAVRLTYETDQVPHEVYSFAQDMAPLFAQADLAICRAGAATCAELTAFAVPSLMVPYPGAAGNHQMYNARAMEKGGAADVIPDAELTEDWLVDYIVGCMRAPERLAKMSALARSLSSKSAARELANLVVSVGRGTKDAAS